MSYTREIFKPTRFKRILFFVLFDILIIVFSFWLSFLLRFGFEFPDRYKGIFFFWCLILIVIKILFMTLFNLYNINWRFVGIFELKNILKTLLFSTILIYLINQFLRSGHSELSIPNSVIWIELIVSFTQIAFLRIFKRLFFLFFRGVAGTSTMIIGADFSGERLIKELMREKDQNLFPRIIIDKNPSMNNTKIHGVPVSAGLEKIAGAIDRYRIKTVMINLQYQNKKVTKNIIDDLKTAGIKDIRIVPSIDSYDDKIYRAKDFKKLSIEDLLSREPVNIEFEKIKSIFKNKTILVTGAAGSIGSEIIRQLIRFNAGTIIGLDIDETRIFDLSNSMNSLTKGQIPDFLISDIRDKKKLERIIKERKPNVIFHAAAYKHVPLMERFPEEAVKTNIFGTMNLVELSLKYKVDKLINISTDKAVNPVGIMGSSKRMSEIICSINSGAETQLISVRFGNVLGSRGSVIPLFLEQIKNGGPITITHQDMKRYFMSQTEAVLLIFQANLMGENGEIFVLDMGEPIKILDLAKTLIILNKLEPYKDIDITFSGIRPGEKLFEELLTAEEGTDFTYHEKIFVARNGLTMNHKKLKKVIKELEISLDNPESISDVLKRSLQP